LTIAAAVFASGCATAAIHRPDGMIMSATVIGDAEISDCYEQCRSGTEPVTPVTCELVVGRCTRIRCGGFTGWPWVDAIISAGTATYLAWTAGS
jgi:hypothetical protein